MKAVLVLLLLSLSSNAAGDCSWTPRRSVDFRTTALDLVTDDGSVWLATGYGVQLVRDGRIVSELALPGLTTAVATSDTGIAYAGSGARVYALRRNGNGLQVTGSAATSGKVNDLVVAGGYLFAATTNGIDHFSLFDASGAPAKTSAVLPTTSPNVTSLAATKTMLYAADGDSTVETYTIALPSLPQHVGVLESLQFSTAVHVSPEGQVIVSDAFGQNTDIFTGTVRTARLPFGTTSYAPLAAQAAFVAGPNRTVAAVDFSSPSRVARLFEHQLAPTDGTDNVIHAVALADGTLYVAGGDMGLLAFDVGEFARPYPLASYSGGATSSVRTDGDRVWFADAAGNISQQHIDGAGLSLTEERTWSAGAGSVIQDARTNGLLTSNGSSVTLWALVSATPTAASTTTFATTVKTAVSSENFLVALLANGSVWRSTGAQTTPEKLSVPPIEFLARSGSAVILGEVRVDDRTTVLHYYPTGDFSAAPQKITIDGVAIGNIALDATRAAVFTFTGINVVDLASGAVRVIPDSNRIIPRQLDFAGNDLLLLDSRRLVVYDEARTAVREHVLPGNAVATDGAGGVALIATTDGTAAVRYLSQLPELESSFTSAFYDRIATSSDRIYLLHDDGIDVLSVLTNDEIRHAPSIRVPGVIGIAATESSLFTLAANARLAAWSRAGIQTSAVTLTEGFDSQPLSITRVGDALWVSVVSGCTSGGCKRNTLVVDPATLAVTATISGALRDVTFDSARAWALFDVPDEVRVFNISDALHPSQLVAAPRPPSATSVSHDAATVYVLGDKLYSYSEASLTLTGERLTAVTPAQSQRLRVDGGCAAVIGRGEGAQLYSVPSWAEAAAPALPSTARAMALQPGRVVILTDHSVEIWSSLSPQKVGRRRSVR